jgi:hypothetical protein
MITQEQLKELWENIDDVIVWKVSIRGKVKGSPVDFTKSQIMIDTKVYTYSKLKNIFMTNSTDTKTRISTKITCEELHKVLDYCKESGIFTWKEYRAGNAKIGQIAGALSPSGYWDIKVGGSSYRAHRLAWLYITGTWPTHIIDHIDRDKLNNKFSNLRDVTPSINTLNSDIRNDNTSGCKGVYPSGINWIAQINVNSMTHYLGTFKTYEEAVHARISQEKKLEVIC